METVTPKSLTLTREDEGVYVITNEIGEELRVGHNVEGGFGFVELLMAAAVGCSSTDLDVMTSRRAEPDTFVATITADKMGGDEGNYLQNVKIEFDVQFPEGPEGDKARARIPVALKAAEERTCTVTRTMSRGTPVELVQKGE